MFIALRETIKRHDIPIDPLRDLLTAFKRDVTQSRYETFEDLCDYCRCSANPVGRLVLMIFNYRDDTLFGYSDSICTALQLANFWQDLSVDRKKDRLYIPLEDMRRFDYSIEDWKNCESSKNFYKLVKFETERTKEFFYKGAELPAQISKDLQLEIRLIWLGGMEILRKIEKNKYNVIGERPKLGRGSKLKILLFGLLNKNLNQYRKRKPKKDPWDLT